MKFVISNIDEIFFKDVIKYLEYLDEPIFVNNQKDKKHLYILPGIIDEILDKENLKRFERILTEKILKEE